jgi:hypothetical protein
MSPVATGWRRAVGAVTSAGPLIVVDLYADSYANAIAMMMSGDEITLVLDQAGLTQQSRMGEQSR